MGAYAGGGCAASASPGSYAMVSLGLGLARSCNNESGWLIPWENTYPMITGNEIKWASAWQNKQNDLCAQRRLRSAWASAQTYQSSLCAQSVAKDPMFLHADSEGSDQTGRMPRLICVFAGRIRVGHFVGFVVLRLKYTISPRAV